MFADDVFFFLGGLAGEQVLPSGSHPRVCRRPKASFSEAIESAKARESTSHSGVRLLESHQTQPVDKGNAGPSHSYDFGPNTGVFIGGEKEVSLSNKFSWLMVFFRLGCSRFCLVQPMPTMPANFQRIR